MILLRCGRLVMQRTVTASHAGSSPATAASLRKLVSAENLARMLSRCSSQSVSGLSQLRPGKLLFVSRQLASERLRRATHWRRGPLGPSWSALWQDIKEF